MTNPNTKTRYCCSDCINDHVLNETIFGDESLATLQDCVFCEKVDRLCIDPRVLFDDFASLLDFYTPAPSGLTFAACLRQDWGFFPESQMNALSADYLVADIFNNHTYTNTLYSRKPSIDENSQIGTWNTIRDTIMHSNRWFHPNQVEIKSAIELFLGSSKRYESHQKDIWYRARLNNGTAEIDTKGMKAPPRYLAIGGRANPPGIPYLYLASDPETAISEIRPHPAQWVTVASFNTRATKIADLREPKNITSPFAMNDDLPQLFLALKLVLKLAESLQRPVRPEASQYEYTPTQYFCEMIKSLGWDGIVFKSSVGEGSNLVLFDPECGIILDPPYLKYEVTKATFSTERRTTKVDSDRSHLDLLKLLLSQTDKSHCPPSPRKE